VVRVNAASVAFRTSSSSAGGARSVAVMTSDAGGSMAASDSSDDAIRCPHDARREDICLDCEPFDLELEVPPSEPDCKESI
jgi:hypothetical protein